ncbi:MAG: hypothetical protein ABIH76_08515 [Candidatus Bathyarchaeota archaeon]
MAETTADTLWSVQYTFPAEGNFHVIGKINTVFGDSFTLMSLFVDTGANPIPISPIQAVFIAFGIALAGGGAYYARKK